MSERYCELCKCDSHSDMPADFKKHWKCPLLGGKNICAVDCGIELEGGMGAPDTLGSVMQMTGKTAWEVHEVCVSCKHGGKALNGPPKLISIRGTSGKQIKSGPEFEEAKKNSAEEWRLRLERLKDPNFKPAPMRGYPEKKNE